LNSKASQQSEALVRGYGLFSPRISNILAFAFSAIMAAAVIDALARIGRHAVNQLRFPVLFLDSWSYVLRDNHHLLGWILAQHNEHRIVWAKLSTVIETDVFKMPPTSTAIVQIFILMLANLGLAFIICQSIQTQRTKLILLWLSCALLLLNPWQSGAFYWEFQTPWIFTNTLVLLSTLLLYKYNQCSLSLQRTIIGFLLVLTPWFSIYNTGQGFALTIGLVIVVSLMRIKLAVSLLISAAGAAASYVWLLPYERSGNAIKFSLRFMLTVILGGDWAGLALLLSLLVVLIICMRLSRMESKSIINIRTELMLPGLFALVFALMTTLSRSSMGLSKAYSGYYVAHTLMLAFSLLLIVAYVDALRTQSPSSLMIKPWTSMPLYNLMSLAVISSTLFSLPQGLVSAKHTYQTEWGNGPGLYWRNFAYNQCYFRKASAVKSQLDGIHCGSWEIWPPEQLKLDYYMGRLQVKPLGWHLSMQESHSGH